MGVSMYFLGFVVAVRWWGKGWPTHSNAFLKKLAALPFEKIQILLILDGKFAQKGNLASKKFQNEFALGLVRYYPIKMQSKPAQPRTRALKSFPQIFLFSETLAVKFYSGCLWIIRFYWWWI